MQSYIYLFIIILITCVSCNAPVKNAENKKSLNAFIPNEILVEYAPLINRDSAYGLDLTVYNKNELDIVDFAFGKVLSDTYKVNSTYTGDITNYKNDSNILSMEDIKRVLGMGPYTLSYMKDGEEVFETFENEFNKEEIVRISFVENWHLDEKSFMLSKDVLRYDFVREYMREADGPKFYTKVFGIINDDSAKNNWEHIGAKVTEANISVLSKSDIADMSEGFKNDIWDDFVSLDHNRNVYWNNYTYNKLVNSLVLALQLGKLKAYDFDSNSELNWNQIKERMGASIKTISYIDENGDEVTKTIEMDMEHRAIRSLLFFEDWYLDKQTLALKKEIKGIAPVRFYVNGLKETVKEVPFVIWYNSD